MSRPPEPPIGTDTGGLAARLLDLQRWRPVAPHEVQEIAKATGLELRAPPELVAAVLTEIVWDYMWTGRDPDARRLTPTQRAEKARRQERALANAVRELGGDPKQVRPLVARAGVLPPGASPFDDAAAPCMVGAVADLAAEIFEWRSPQPGSPAAWEEQLVAYSLSPDDPPPPLWSLQLKALAGVQAALFMARRSAEYWEQVAQMTPTSGRPGRDGIKWACGELLRLMRVSFASCREIEWHAGGASGPDREPVGPFVALCRWFFEEIAESRFGDAAKQAMGPDAPRNWTPYFAAEAVRQAPRKIPRDVRGIACGDQSSGGAEGSPS